MTITADQLAQIRRMTNEPTTTPYSDAMIRAIAEDHTVTESGYPGETATVYDLNAVAAQIWEEKAAALSPEVAGGSADAFGETSDKFQETAYEKAVKQRDYYFSRRKPRSRKPVKWPREVETETTL